MTCLNARERERERDAFHLAAVAVYLRTGNRGTPQNIHVILCVFWGEKLTIHSFHGRSKLKWQKSGYSLLYNTHSPVFIDHPFLFHSSSLSCSENPSANILSLSLFRFLTTLAHFALHLLTHFWQFFSFLPLTLDMLNCLLSYCSTLFFPSVRLLIDES